MNGFDLKEKRFVAELNANVYYYFHNQSGAKLIHIDNDDINKVFSVAFRTPPKNNTGVAHIVEHSVLCGSEKFPLKEPYKELLKGSLYTFLNAMTENDFTVYPVASINDKDFKILSEVCMDSVFFPKLATMNEIFYQEGWHYQLDNKNADMSINGVVYNEMQNFYSDPNQMISFEIQKALFPDTVYKNNSDGLSDEIPDLSIQKFRDFHQKHYHPSNAYFFLYGKINIEDMLDMINNEVLSRFNKTEIDTKIPYQTSFQTPIEQECDYPILQEDDENNNTWHSLGFMLDLKNDPSLYFSLQILVYLLFETPESPLKNAIIKSNICDDVSCVFDGDTLQPTLRITISGSEVIHKEKFKKVLFKALQAIYKNGIDKELIESAIAINEFELREANHPIYPKGILYMLNMLPHWIHDFDAINFLCYEKYLENAKSGLTSDYFESLIKKYLLDNNHYALVTLKPKQGLSEQSHYNLQEKLKTIKNSLSTTEINNILKQNKKLLKWQNSLDSDDLLSTIPTMSLNDIDKNAFDYSVKINESIDNDFIFHNYDKFTNGIVNLKMYFFPTYLPKKLVQYAQAITNILGKINTKNYSSNEFSNQINLKTGGIEFEFGAFENSLDVYDFKPYFSVSSKAMMPQMESMIDLIKELIQNTIFDDHKKLKEILLEHKSFTEMLLLNLSNMYAHFRVSAYYSNIGRFREYTQGIEYYFFLVDLLKNFNKNHNEIINNFCEAYRYIFNNIRTRISITAPENDIKKTQEYLKVQLNDLNHFHCDSQPYYFEPLTPNEAFILPSRSQFVAKGYLNKDIKFNGEFDVLEEIISLDYLWKKIRVKGGAYGSSFHIGTKGDVIASSTRDPNLKETIEAYDNIPNYLKKLKLSEKEFSKYIIGAIRKYDSPKTPYQISCLSDLYHFTNREQFSIQRDRELILESSLKKLKKYTGMLENTMNQNCICVFGSEIKIKENTNLFNKIVNVF